MHYGAAISTLRTVMTTATTNGATIPKPLAADYAALVGLAEQVRDFTTDLGDTVGAAVLDALAEGRDPATDPAVQAALNARALLVASGALDDALAIRAQTFIETNAAQLLEACRKPFDRAAATLADAHDFLGDVDLTDSRAVLATGGNAATAWAQANDAERTIAAIVKAWKLVAQLTRAIPYHHRHPLLVTVAPPADDYLEHAASVATPWDAVRRGWTLDLATPESYAARIGDVNNEQTRRDTFADQAHARDFQRTAGIAS